MSSSNSNNNLASSQIQETRLIREVPDSQESQQTHYGELDDLSDVGLSLDSEYDLDTEALADDQSFHGDSPRAIPDETPGPQRGLDKSPKEIPDSQESREEDSNEELNEGGPAKRASTFSSVATEIIPGGTQITHRNTPKAEPQHPKAPFPLHERGVNRNGRLAMEAPQYRDANMEETATQPTTQPQFDARRHGASSQLSRQDEADIIVILHPTSPAAHVAVNLTAEASPQHIWQNHRKSHVLDDDELESDDASMSKDHAQDIALRFSSRVNNINMGFVFGRNVQTSDIFLVRPESKEDAAQQRNKKFAISNKHFRIYVNKNGIIMIEDTSTNGTVVDGVVLRSHKARDQSNNPQPRITLHSGVIIELPTYADGESIRFVVNIPPRYTGEAQFHDNLKGYLAFIDQTERKAEAVRAAREGKKVLPSNVPLLTNALPAALQQPTAVNTPTTYMTTGGNSHGLHWNGGEKYNVVGHIGAGSFATVCKLSSKRDGEVFACKQLQKARVLRDNLLSKKFNTELELMMAARHPNIIEYIDHYETPTHLFIIMEYIPFGDLRHWTNSSKPMTEYMAARVGRQMLDAVIYLHERGITHRDIKPDNILVAGDDPLDKIFKLTDFGLSKQVMDASTFLQTFCGTVLYLAPEVYPGYDRARNGLGPAKRTRGQMAAVPYKRSVDIWSLGTVLYQLLTGKPPWVGGEGDSREDFLYTVMNVPVDYERLVYQGVTRDAINFISRMLVTDPQNRADEMELTDHPWLIPKPYPEPRGRKVADDDETLDASQLSLAENDDDDELMRDAKRARGDNWTGDEDEHILDDDDGHRMLPGGLPYSYFEPRDNGPSLRMSGPPPPQTQSQLYPGMRKVPVPAQAERLFGEISSSALGSSGVLGQNANLALGVSTEVTEGATDEHNDESFEHNNSDTSADNTHVNTPRSNTVKRAIQPSSDFPRPPADASVSSAAPSLLGAEALVGQLNMTSPEHSNSPHSVSNERHTPEGTQSRDFSPNPNNTKRPSESTTDQSRNKRSKKGTTPPSSHVQPSSTTASIEQHPSASRPSDCSGSIESAAADEDGSAADADPKLTSQGNNSNNEQDAQQTTEKGKSAALQESNATSQNSAPTPDNKDSQKESQVAPNPPSASPSTAVSLYPSITLAPTSDSTADGFLKPTMRFGTLLLIPGSIKSVGKIRINTMGTSYGRHPTCTYVHPNPKDNRIPKYAFDIQMWYPSIDKDLAAGKTDWATHPDLVALIRAGTSVGIAVNGVRLKRGKDCWQFGKLQSGDVVSVVELKEGVKPRTEADREWLRYKAEFYVGASKVARKVGEMFAVEKEEEKYKAYIEKMTRGESVENQEGVPPAAASHESQPGVEKVAEARAEAKEASTSSQT
ncbi:Protein kinase protein rad53 [Lecanora helva]